MTEKERIEAAIREVLTTGISAILVSNQLFRPGGLFSQLAATVEDRREVSRSPLFEEAQRRLAELRHVEVVEFERTVEQAQATMPSREFLLRVEPVA
jgi:hypothetical protein